MTTLLSSADYDTIRTILHADALLLPDTTLDLVLPLADREIKRLAPAWETYTGDDLAALEDATRYLTAARSVDGVSKVGGLGFSIEYRPPSVESLLALAYAALRALGLTFSTTAGFAVRSVRADGYTALSEW